MNAPIEPLAGLVIDGGGGGIGGGGGGATGLSAVTCAPAKVMVGSSAIIVLSKLAQPGWLSTTWES